MVMIIKKYATHGSGPILTLVKECLRLFFLTLLLFVLSVATLLLIFCWLLSTNCNIASERGNDNGLCFFFAIFVFLVIVLLLVAVVDVGELTGSSLSLFNMMEFRDSPSAKPLYMFNNYKIKN